MDHEEREEIPWSNLVSQVEPITDRRWLLAAAVVAALVVGVVGYRAVSSQPSDPPTAEPSIEVVDASFESTSSTSIAPASVMTEAELTSDEAPDLPALHLLRAETFVTDFFTHDGSEESRRSVREAVVPELRDAVPVDAPESATFVEWARAFDTTTSEDRSVIIRVAYRPLVASETGYQRLPVEFVSVGVRAIDGVPFVSRLPEPEEPWTPWGLR